MSDGPLSRLGAVSPRGQPCIPPVFRTALISRSSDWSPSVDIPASRVFAPSFTGASFQETQSQSALQRSCASYKIQSQRAWNQRIISQGASVTYSPLLPGTPPAEGIIIIIGVVIIIPSWFPLFGVLIQDRTLATVRRRILLSSLHMGEHFSFS